MRYCGKAEGGAEAQTVKYSAQMRLWSWGTKLTLKLKKSNVFYFYLVLKGHHKNIWGKKKI